MRLFSKHSEFRTDGSMLEEVDMDLNEKRREESEHLIECSTCTALATWCTCQYVITLYS